MAARAFTLALVALPLALATPVNKVVEMLKDMKGTLESEQKADEEMYADLQGWCKENNNLKTVEVTDGQAKIAELTNLANELNASAEALATEMIALAKEVKEATATVDSARTIHANKVEEFTGNEKSLYQDIEAVESAKTAISGSNPVLAQMPASQLKEVSSRLQRAVTRRAERLDNTLSVKDHENLEAFFKDPSGFAEGLSLMQAPEGGVLTGMLEAMGDDFHVDLKALQEEMAREDTTYEELMAGKKAEIKASEGTMESKRLQRVEKRESMLEAGFEIKNIEKAIGTSADFLKLVEEKCGETDEMWTERTSTRKDEIAAVAKAIEVLTADGAKTSFKKTYGLFLQKEVADDKLKRASQALKRAAAVQGDRRLKGLAKALEVKGMEKVLKAVEEMKVALKKEQQDEVDQRDFCIKSFNENKVKVEEMKDLKGQHNAKLEMLADKLKTTAASVSVAQGKVESAKKELAKAAEEHAEELADFNTTLFDQNATKVLLNEALDSLKSFYMTPPKKSLLQKASLDDVPEGFKDYKTSDSGNAVTQLLQQVLLDTKAMEAETLRAKTSAEKQFAKLSEATNADIAALMDELDGLAKVKAKALGAVHEEKSNLKGAEKELADLAVEEANLHETCDFLLNNFGLRQTARTEELEGLDKAKSFLRGASFLQLRR
mmetsp:Transcript_12896/g.24313  ORF Transcript_12896/g.24313 Transcript_12896/m.24313 type:complete len:666 (+) Transcript_12896:76-2073(+)